MNLPNKLTLLRVCLIPFFLLFFYIDIPFHYLISLVVFAGASITDALDGNIARKRNLVTNFGKLLSALAVFVEVPEIRVGAIPLIIISAREFMVSGLRLLAADSGIVVAAGIWGKLKTAFTMTAIVASLAWLSLRFDIGAELPETLCSAVDNAVIPALIWISTILTVISGAIYLKGYWYLIDSDK